MAAHGKPIIPLKLVLLNIKTIFHKLLAFKERSLRAHFLPNNRRNLLEVRTNVC